MKTSTPPSGLRTWQWFALLVAVGWLDIYILQTFVLTDSVYRTILSDQWEANRIDQVIEFYRKISQWSYVISPCMLLFKIMLITLLIQFPLVIRFIDVPISQLFKRVTQAFFFLWGSSFARTLRLWGIREPRDVSDFQTVPFSLTTLFDHWGHKGWLTLMEHINLFEGLWLVALVFGLARSKQVSRSEAILITGFVWVLIVAFDWLLNLYLENMGL